MAAKTSKFITQAAKVEVITGPGGATQETRNIFVSPSQLNEFALLVEENFPDCYLHEPAIAKGGKNPNATDAEGNPVNNVSLALKTDNPNGMATVWYSGKGTLTGVMASLPWG